MLICENLLLNMYTKCCHGSFNLLPMLYINTVYLCLVLSWKELLLVLSTLQMIFYALKHPENQKDEMQSICTKDIPLNSVSVLGLGQDLGHIDTF